MAQIGVTPIPPAINTECGALSIREKLLRGGAMSISAPMRSWSCR